MNDPTPMSTEKLVALADAYLAGELKPEELVALERALKNSSSSRALFALVTDQAAMMREVFTSKQTAEFQIEQRDTSEFLEVLASLEDHSNSAQIVDLTDELKRRKLKKHQKKAAEKRWLLGLNQSDSSPSVLHQYVIPKLVAGLGVAALIGLVVWLGLDKTPPTQDASYTDGTDSSMTETVQPSAIVATIRHSANAQWIGQYDPNQFLREGQAVTLSSGFAEIVFGSGATLIVEGPATFKPTGPNAMRLDSGRIVASVPTSAQGFTVTTDSGVITDYGTEFGVLANHAGQTLAETFTGRVGFTPTGSAEEAQLMAGDAVVVNRRGQVREVESDELAFVRSAEFKAIANADRSPYDRWLAHSYQMRRMDGLILYYSFDNAIQGQPIENLAANYLGQLSGEIVGQTRIVPGRFGRVGRAMDFGSQGESHNWIVVDPSEENLFDFRGSFSVGIWIKTQHLPSEWRTLIAKGDESWRIQTGAPGLDIDGTLQLQTGPAVGPADGVRSDIAVDDGRWHHWVVTYHDDDDAGRGTYTVYLDGKRIAQGPSTHRMHHSEDPVYIGHVGRNPRTNSARQFNGQVDEVMIFDRLLSPQEVSEMYRIGGGDNG